MPRKHVVRATITLIAVVLLPQSVGRAQYSVSPTMLDLILPNGMATVESVSLTIHPFCVSPVEVNVAASDAMAPVQNLSGVLLNGCGEDTSTFDVRFTGDGMEYSFDLQFVDAEFGHVLGAIPVTIVPEPTASALLGFAMILCAVRWPRSCTRRTR